MEILDITLLIVRIILGSFFIAYGFGKLKNPKDIAKWLNSIGYNPGIFWAWVLVFTEFFGGICVLIGLLSRFFALLMSVVLVLGIVHRVKKKELKFSDGWDFNWISLASTIILILLGSGKISLDAIFGIF